MSHHRRVHLDVCVLRGDLEWNPKECKQVRGSNLDGSAFDPGIAVRGHSNPGGWRKGGHAERTQVLCVDGAGRQRETERCNLQEDWTSSSRHDEITPES